MATAAELSRQQEQDAALAATASQLEVAKREWQEAIEALSNPTVATSLGTSKGITLANLTDSLSKSFDTVAAQQGAIETKSTFNAFAIRGLGADSLAERSLRAAEQTAANTQKLIRVMEDNGLAYS
jgi:hypothetical protein